MVAHDVNFNDFPCVIVEEKERALPAGAQGSHCLRPLAAGCANRARRKCPATSRDPRIRSMPRSHGCAVGPETTSGRAQPESASKNRLPWRPRGRRQQLDAGEPVKTHEDWLGSVMFPDGLLAPASDPRPCTRRRARLRELLAAIGERPTMGAISSNGTPNMSCSTKKPAAPAGFKCREHQQRQPHRVATTAFVLRIAPPRCSRASDWLGAGRRVQAPRVSSGPRA